MTEAGSETQSFGHKVLHLAVVLYFSFGRLREKRGVRGENFRSEVQKKNWFKSNEMGC